jgi:deoxyribodipyrimidine photolyase-related protein
MLRHLILVLGDQLNEDASAFDGFDVSRDAVWMAEVPGEAEHVKSHKARIVLFLSAMRHFRDRLRSRGITVHYRNLEDPQNEGSLTAELKAAMQRLEPRRLIVTKPGEWRVEQSLKRVAGDRMEIRSDRHFLCSAEAFSAHARGRKQLRMEFFYREMRRRTGVLMDGNKPAGGKWNYDPLNRGAFGREGPGNLPLPLSFEPDALTRKVLRIVGRRFTDHPGSLDHFDWPVTPGQARDALDDFIAHRLAGFGDFQDAMWTGEPFLHHALLSSSLNLKLIDPRRVLKAAEGAFAKGRAPLPAVEGFIRQILGWREYVRGIYWRHMPGYLELNALGAGARLPAFYWTADTEMHCLREAIGQTLEHGYAHHIQRLMVTGLFALLLGVDPHEVHEWYLAMYVDAVEWVELPNTLGMSQFADGGIMASKPYAATGKYIHRMSNYCTDCCFRPDRALNDGACPFTTLYWDFLLRHERSLKKIPRMRLQLRNAAAKDQEERRSLRRGAEAIRKRILT